MKKVYFDSAATSQLRNEVIHTMTNVLKTEYGNPSSTHTYGRSSKSLLENCRKEIAKLFNVQASEIIFTSGGTEADNLAIQSCVRSLGVQTIITSKLEHHAVLHTVDSLKKKEGIEVVYVNHKEDSSIDIDHFEILLKKFQNLKISRNNRPPPNNRTPKKFREIVAHFAPQAKNFGHQTVSFQGVNVFLRRRRKILDIKRTVFREAKVCK